VPVSTVIVPATAASLLATVTSAAAAESLLTEHFILSIITSAVAFATVQLFFYAAIAEINA
jgi:hypothetical protein